MNTSIPAVVLDLSANGLGIIRSLARKKITVYAFDTKGKYKRGKSRLARCDSCPDPESEEQELLDFLLSFQQKLMQKPVLFAGSDDFILFISKHREKLREHFLFLFPDHTLIEAVLDKSLTHKLALSHNVDAPKTFLLNEEAELHTIRHSLSFPCILKPVISHQFRKRLNVKAIVVETIDELVSDYPKYREFGQLMLQEIIPGEENRIYQIGTLFDENMKLTGLFMGQKLQQFPPNFGTGSIVLSKVDKEVVRQGVHFIRNLNFTGLSVAEYKRDPRDNKLKFIEINARTTLWHSLSERCGVDLSWLYYQLLTGQNPEPRLTQKEGVKWVYFVRAFLSFLQKRKAEKARILPWLKSMTGKKESALFAWDDPMPFFRITFSHLRNFFRKNS